MKWKFSFATTSSQNRPYLTYDVCTILQNGGKITTFTSKIAVMLLTAASSKKVKWRSKFTCICDSHYFNEKGNIYYITNTMLFITGFHFYLHTLSITH